MDPLDGLNPEQRRAAEAVRGPVCILAGAGSGKTTTITRRIAQQVASSAFEPTQIMAVTFTDKAAGELRARLAALGVQRVRAGTFHSAALRQLRHFAPETVGRILPSKVLVLRQIANGLPPPYKFRPAGDLATEIEWAKNRRVSVARYRTEAERREPPIPVELMHRVYRDYEKRKEAEGSLDFEDLLELAVQLFERDERVCRTFRTQYRAFTVDEYQDVNLLQQELLEHWLGGRDDLCVVGDDYQSIYAFTGAGPEHLLDVPRRYPSALVVRLEENYRSTPQVLALANRLVPKLGGAEKILRPTLDDGPEPVVRAFATSEAEGRDIVAAIRSLGVPLEEVAILCRTNARLTDFEELLHEAHIPFQGASLLQRDAARRIVRRLERLGGVDAEEAVRAAAVEAGWLAELPEKLGDRELVRQTDLARLVALAEVFDGDAVAFVADLRRRFDPGGDSAKGVHLLTLHRAKGLEFHAVFLPRLEEKELPSRQARTAAEIAEERRLLYVGMTRAKRVLWLTWSAAASRFVGELGVSVAKAAGAPKPAKGKFVPTAGSDGLYHELAVWRRARAEKDEVPPYVVFDNKTLDAIARTRPQTLRDLAALPGVGPVKLERYGNAVLALVGRS
ncbi:MAG: ATP-dependent DNA helicase UvrD2 [Actinomycetota bacterium]|nr:ATP-dependent DNA helicase UvrD2 [Actinomycetota bacterium]